MGSRLTHDPFDTIRLPLLSAASRCASRWRMMTHHDGQRLSRPIVRASTKQAMALTEGIKGGVLRLPPEFRGDLGRGDFGEIITSWQAGSPSIRYDSVFRLLSRFESKARGIIHHEAPLQLTPPDSGRSLPRSSDSKSCSSSRDLVGSR